MLDRGDAELPILYFLERLQEQAAAAGGALHVLNGNHETMNVAGNYRYATAGADREMAAWAAWQLLGDRLRRRCGCASAFGDDASAAAALSGVVAAEAHPPGAAAGSSGGRAAQFNPMRRAALRPGGPVARRFFARHPTVLQVGSTLFVHGGVLPGHVEYGLGAINGEAQAWLLGGGAGSGAGSGKGDGGSGKGGDGGGGAASPTRGGGGGWWFGRKGAGAADSKQQQQQQQQQQPSSSPPPTPPQAPAFLRGAHAVVWARDYSQRDEARCDCAKLEAVLGALPGAARMVVGHTIQDGGITAACGGRVFRVDVGMSAGCGDGEPEVLEILGDGASVRRLAEGAQPEAMWPPPEPGAPHAPHHLAGAPRDTPAGAWGEALQRVREALGVGAAAGGGGAGPAAEGKQQQPQEQQPRGEPTPA